MDIRIIPRALAGTVQAPSSKSMTHRELICAALAAGESVVDNVSPSKDIEATIRCMAALGAHIEETASAYPGRRAYRTAGGLAKRGGPVTCACGESGSTLRFLIPIGLYSGNCCVFTGEGRLGERPLAPYFRLFDEKGIGYAAADGLPLTAEGTLTPGRYVLPGDVSSQFFSGLLFVLPLLPGDSELRAATPVESESYIGMTVDAMARHGVRVDRTETGWRIPGGQRYRPGRFAVEGDWSQGAFWLAAGLLGKDIAVTGLPAASPQGDRVVADILRRMGGALEAREGALCAAASETRGTVIDAEDCPDLVPVLTALAAVSRGRTEIVHAARVRLKECDRLHAMAAELTKLGARIEEQPDGLVIDGVETLSGGVVDGWNDHRVAMALAAVSSRCAGPLTITGAECVAKSYPAFWRDFRSLGGFAEERN